MSTPSTLQALEDARHRAEDLVTDLGAELIGIGESTAMVPDDEHDPEGSTVGFERARVSALLEVAQHNVAELAEAAERLRSEPVDRCQQCGKEIPVERRTALPSTRSCVRCAAVMAPRDELLARLHRAAT